MDPHSHKGTPFAVRYPFDVLRAVSQIEPLTTNGESDTSVRLKAFALRFTRLGGARGEQGIEGQTQPPKISGSRAPCPLDLAPILLHLSLFL